MTTQNPATAAPAETTVQEEAVVVVEPTFLEKVVTKHPRLAKVAAITGAIGTVASVALVTTNLKRNAHHVNAAQDHLALAAGEFTEAVVPTSETTDK